MDEHDVISRREAVAGLGLLGVLCAGLIGTIVFRIVHASPKQATPSQVTLWASDSVPPSDPTAEVAAAPLAADQLPAAGPIPTVTEGQAEVPTVSASAPVEDAAPPLQSEPPRFVAPGSR